MMNQILYHQHPCFCKVKNEYARIHLPVAVRCNLGCRYCNAKIESCRNDFPGSTDKILTVEEALMKLKEQLIVYPNLKVVGINGPGDPLANSETISLFSKIEEQFPYLIKCMSTNGIEMLLMRDKLLSTHINAVTLTINSFEISTLKKIYSYVYINNNFLYGESAARAIRDRQEIALTILSELDCLRKINIVYIEGINDKEIIGICKKIQNFGDFKINLMKLIPAGDLRHIKINMENFLKVYTYLKNHFDLSLQCNQCRSDACGTLK